MKYFLAFLPMGLIMAAQALMSRDTNNTGADDALGQVCLAIQPAIPDLLAGEGANQNATLKAMRAIELVAHNYRVQVGDPTLGQGGTMSFELVGTEEARRVE